jgi:cellobiose phosphorylase
MALAPYWALRLNEYYVSQYVDHTPLFDPAQGYVVASRQNLPAEGRHPWCLSGSLRCGESFATDALQLHGCARRAGEPTPPGLGGWLPGRRLQHEHSMVVLRDTPLWLAPAEEARTGFFGLLMADHPQASALADLERMREALGLPEATPGARVPGPSGKAPARSLFDTAVPLPVTELQRGRLEELFGRDWRHEERDAHGGLLSFFHGTEAHVVLRAKELAVLRPHGHILRTGAHLTPDETALTSTVWMSGVFHSLLTQGHVAFNRLLSTTHSYLDLFRSHGLRVFVELDGKWWLLHVPSAFEMAPARCRWIYAHAGGTIEVTCAALSDPHTLTVSLTAQGTTPRWLISLHLAVDGDDGCAPGVARWSRDGEEILITGSELAARFPRGAFRLVPLRDVGLRAGGDELLFADGVARGEPFLCLRTERCAAFSLDCTGELVTASTPRPLQLARAGSLTTGIELHPPAGPAGAAAAALGEIVPWLAHDAWVHYLAPRGLEQYTGGGWGTRDVCQGPVDLLLAHGHLDSLRDLLLRVMAAQNPDGDWPQWFMFFERDRAIRAGDSHGDILLWPVVALAQYLAASSDAEFLEEVVPFFAADPALAQAATVWEHVQRALSLAAARALPGTHLMACGHGDWNDSLQPADPNLRARLCSSWTVTLHHQALMSMAERLRALGRHLDAAVEFTLQAGAIRADIQRLLLVDGVLAGYALLDPGEPAVLLLHPQDHSSSVRYSLLAMSQAVLQDMLTPQEAHAHLRLVREHLEGPDGFRLFDHPLPYRGGPERLFQRAEEASFFGREIGLMYMHAHLRHAQALAHAGDAEGFFRALCQANPIGVRDLVPAATLRQSNCYYSSSDAAFSDRYQADREYGRVAQQTVALEGGWRVYSSGAGIALRLIRQVLLGLTKEPGLLIVDPVMPASLDGLRHMTHLFGRPVEVCYRPGPRGCGVRRITLNGTALAFRERPALYRPGAALLTQAALAEHLEPDGSQMQIELG